MLFCFFFSSRSKIKYRRVCARTRISPMSGTRAISRTVRVFVSTIGGILFVFWEKIFSLALAAAVTNLMQRDLFFYLFFYG